MTPTMRRALGDPFFTVCNGTAHIAFTDRDQAGFQTWCGLVVDSAAVISLRRNFLHAQQHCLECHRAWKNARAEVTAFLESEK